MAESKPISGLTPRSLLAMFLAMLATAMMTQVGAVLMNFDFISEYTLGVPAILTILILIVISGVLYSVTRFRLLNKAEMLCVLYATLIASPLLTQGFWHRILAVIATIPRTGDFQKMDALSDRLWPHGPNLLSEAWEVESGMTLEKVGQVTTTQQQINPGRSSAVLRLESSQDTQVVRVRMKLPLQADGRSELIRNEPHLASVLVRADGLSSQASYYCRVYFDDTEQFVDLYRSNAQQKVTFLQKEGFVRVGAYGVVFPGQIESHVIMEWGLEGRGVVELADPKLFSVGALEYAFKGKRTVTRAEFEALPQEQRVGLVVEPENYLSWQGLMHLITGYIPLADWREPGIAWTSFVLIILMASLALSVIMRRQWMDNERYQMPVAKITVALLDNERTDASWPELFRNSMVWVGFVVTLAWCLMKGLAFYNPKLPDMRIQIDLGQYFSDPGWGGAWGMHFNIFAIFLSMAIFMELNVLLSMAVGYVLYRAQYWVGEFTGWNVQTGYPWQGHQQVGAYVAYALIVVVLSWKYLWGVLKQAVNGKQESPGELMSYRVALLLLLGCFAGGVMWSMWVGVSVVGMMLFLLFIVSVAFVSTKIRTECGLPFGYFTPYNAMFFVSLLGGMTVFGAEAIIVCLIAGFFLGPTVFFLIPGAQMEMIEIGRRWNIKPKQVLATCVLGVLGGMLLGGWVFLSNAYALGGETLKYAWAFQEKSWYFFPFNADLTAATNQMQAQASGGETVQAALNPSTLAFGFAFIVTSILTVLRQIFSGFWFHPVGFILGSTFMFDQLFTSMWGSVITAWGIRWTVLKIGGAQTVRTKLLPFFMGVFIASVLSVVIWIVVGIYLRTQYGIEQLYNAVP